MRKKPPSDKQDKPSHLKLVDEHSNPDTCSADDQDLNPDLEAEDQPATSAPKSRSKQPAATLEAATAYGRPTKCTPALQKKFMEAVAAGAAYTTACGYAGINYQTFLNWRERAAAAIAAEAEGTPIATAELPYVEFLEALEKANEAAEVECLKRINTAGKKGWWQADAWLLERRLPHKYGRRDTIKTVGDPNEPQVNVTVSAGEHIPPEDVMAVLARYSATTPGADDQQQQQQQATGADGRPVQSTLAGPAAVEALQVQQATQQSVQDLDFDQHSQPEALQSPQEAPANSPAPSPYSAFALPTATPDDQHEQQ